MTLGPIARPRVHSTPAYIFQLADELWAFARRPATRAQYDALHQRLVALSRLDWHDGRHTQALWRCAELLRQAVDACDPWTGTPTVDWQGILGYLRAMAMELRARDQRLADPRRRLSSTGVLGTRGGAA
ncbi:MAG: hypothetical protein OHK0024_35980 [Thalassobaculales bacterium]